MKSDVEYFSLEERLSAFLRRATRGPRSALFFTFHFDGSEFLNKLWLPILLRQGFNQNNAAVFYDARFLGNKEFPPIEYSRPLLFPVVLKKGCFHPKLFVVTVGKIGLSL